MISIKLSLSLLFIFSVFKFQSSLNLTGKLAVQHSLTRESAIIQQAGLGDKKHGETEDDMLASQECGE